MANLLAYGVLGGVGGYANGQAQALSHEQRMQEQAALRYQQEEQRQQDRLELARERAALGGGRGSKGDGDGPFDPDVAEKQYRFAAGMTPEQEDGIRSGEAFVTQRIKQFNEDGSSSLVSETRQDGWQELQRQKIAELDAIRKNVAFGKNAEHAAKAESEYQDIGMAEGVRKKDGDYAGLLAKQGKGLYDNSGESGAFNVETGEQKLNRLGEAKATKELAEGGWYGRRTSNDTSDAEGRRDLNARRILLNSKITTLENTIKSGQFTREDGGRAGALAKLSALREELLQLGPEPKEGGAGSGKIIRTKGGRTVTMLGD